MLLNTDQTLSALFGSHGASHNLEPFGPSRVELFPLLLVQTQDEMAGNTPESLTVEPISNHLRATLHSQETLLGEVAQHVDNVCACMWVPLRAKQNCWALLISCVEAAQLRTVVTDHHLARLVLVVAIIFERLCTTQVLDCNARILSNRERACLLLLTEGLIVKQIARRLDISESAVHLYISNAKRKLKARTREEAVTRAIATGEIAIGQW